MIGKIYNCPEDVCESGQMIVVGRDSDPVYNPMRKAWFLQVREYLNGEAIGPWIPVTKAEFMKWNPNVPITQQQWLARGNTSGPAELC